MTTLLRSTSRCLVVLATCVTLAACGSSDDSDGDGAKTDKERGDATAAQYPDASRTAYMNSCTAAEGATDEICERSLECIEARIPYEEFDAGEKAMIAGEPNEEFMSKVSDCATSAAR